jgi:hypothetical protein
MKNPCKVFILGTMKAAMVFSSLKSDSEEVYAEGEGQVSYSESG